MPNINTNYPTNNSINVNTPGGVYSVKGQGTGPVAQQGEPVVELKSGDTISGEIVSRDGNDVSLRVGKDVILNARMDQDIQANAGDQILFEIRANSAGNISLRPLYQNLTQDSPIYKALNQAQLPVDNTSSSMVAAMMKEGMSIDSESLQAMYKSVMDLPDTNLNTLVQMSKLDIPITQDSIIQFEAYKNFEHQLGEAFNDVAAQIPGAVDEAFAESGIKAGNDLIGKLLDTFSFEPGAGRDVEITQSRFEYVPDLSMSNAANPESNIALQNGQDGQIPVNPDGITTQGTQGAFNTEGTVSTDIQGAVITESAAATDIQGAVIIEGTIPADSQGMVNPEGITNSDGQAMANPEGIMGADGQGSDVIGKDISAATPSGVQTNEPLPNGDQANAVSDSSVQNNTPFADKNEGIITNQADNSMGNKPLDNVAGNNTAFNNAVGDNTNNAYNDPVALNPANNEEGSFFVKNDGNPMHIIKGESAPSVASLENQVQLSKQEAQNLATLVKNAGGSPELSQKIAQGKASNSEIYEAVRSLSHDAKDTASQMAVKELFTSKGFQSILKERISTQWNIRDSSQVEKQEIKDLYERIEKQTREVARALADAVKPDSALSKSIGNIRENVDFMNQLNQLTAYVQLPMKWQGMDAHGDLYVYTNRKSLAKDGSVSAFLHLEMEHLGNVDVYVAMEKERVSTNFTVDDDETLDLLEKNMDMLTKRLEDKGYKTSAKLSIKGEEEGAESGDGAMGGILKDKRNISVISMQAFDVRA